MRLSAAQVYALQYWALPLSERYGWASRQPRQRSNEYGTWTSLEGLGLLTGKSSSPDEDVLQLTQEGWRELRRREVLAPGKRATRTANPTESERATGKGWPVDDVLFGQHHRPPRSDFERVAAAVLEAGPEGLSESQILDRVPFATLAKLKSAVRGAESLGLIVRRDDGVFVAKEFAVYQATPASPAVINVGDLDPGERTIAYGYTTELDTWHAYVMDDKIHVIVYSRAGGLIDHRQAASMPPELLRPNRRAFPDTVDRKFAELMRDAGSELPFLGNFDFDDPDVAERAARGAFKGKTHYDFT